jgi:hypothetical protein
MEPTGEHGVTASTTNAVGGRQSKEEQRAAATNLGGNGEKPT